MRAPDVLHRSVGYRNPRGNADAPPPAIVGPLRSPPRYYSPLTHPTHTGPRVLRACRVPLPPQASHLPTAVAALPPTAAAADSRRRTAALVRATNLSGVTRPPRRRRPGQRQVRISTSCRAPAAPSQPTSEHTTTPQIWTGEQCGVYILDAKGRRILVPALSVFATANPPGAVRTVVGTWCPQPVVLSMISYQ